MTRTFLLAYAGSDAAGKPMSAVEFEQLKAQVEHTTPARKIRIGDRVRIRKGVCGEGYQFTVTETGTSGHGERILYGYNYGPVRETECELVS